MVEKYFFSKAVDILLTLTNVQKSSFKASIIENIVNNQIY